MGEGWLRDNTPEDPTKLTMSPAERTQLADEIERHEHGRLKRGEYRELHERPKEKGPRCGHSVCSQHYIDTGDPRCIHRQRLGVD